MELVSNTKCCSVSEHHPSVLREVSLYLSLDPRKLLDFLISEFWLETGLTKIFSLEVVFSRALEIK